MFYKYVKHLKTTYYLAIPTAVAFDNVFVFLSVSSFFPREHLMSVGPIKTQKNRVVYK